MPNPNNRTDSCHDPAIGIIMLDTVFPRIPGDVGNQDTFSFPVRYRVVKGASPHRVVKEADPLLLQPFIEAARALEKQGVKAIATSCRRSSEMIKRSEFLRRTPNPSPKGILPR